MRLILELDPPNYQEKGSMFIENAIRCLMRPLWNFVVARYRWMESDWAAASLLAHPIMLV